MANAPPFTPVLYPDPKNRRVRSTVVRTPTGLTHAVLLEEWIATWKVDVFAEPHIFDQRTGVCLRCKGYERTLRGRCPYRLVSKQEADAWRASVVSPAPPSSSPGAATPTEEP